MDTDIQQKFTELYDTPPVFVVRAPGRVNLIGEHTDYNDGFVFPAAINFDVTIAGAPRQDDQVRAYSTRYLVSDTFTLSDIQEREKGHWSNFIRGVAHVLRSEGYPLKGMNLVVHGTVPIASGLSSSAAMEIASCLAFETAGGFAIDPVQRALYCQRAEHAFAKVKCGIMDQFISSLGRAGHALLIDTRSREYEAVPLPAQRVSLVIGDTGLPRGLGASKYNERRTECESAVEILKRSLPGITALRDVDEESFARYADQMPETIRKRARHVITENARVLKSVAALKAGDIAQFGQLMNASHDSLRDDYEVSCRELDVMVEAARQVEGVFGARMTGAGFGGCTVSLVADKAVENFKKIVGAAYLKETGREAKFYVCQASEGASRIL